MHDLERDLLQYGTVLREQARAVPLSEVKARIGKDLPAYRPARAAATGALLVLASIGVLFLGMATLELVDIGRSVAPASDRPSGLSAMATAAGGGALLVLASAAAFGVRHRHRWRIETRIRERRKTKMQTLEKPTAPIEKMTRNNRYLIIGLVVAVLLAAGLGAWILADTIGTSTEREISALLDEYGAAWEAGDGEAAVKLMTEDAAVTAGNGVTYPRSELIVLIDSMTNFTAKQLGDALVIESTGPLAVGGWEVAVVSLIDNSYHTLDLFRIVDQDGEFLIEYHETWRGNREAG